MVGVMSIAVPTITTSTMIAISSSVWLPMNGSSRPTTLLGRSRHRDQPGRHQRRRDQEHDHRGGLGRGDEDRVQLRQLQLAVDEHRDEQRVDRRHHGRLGRREDAELQADDDDHRQHQRPDALAQRAARPRRADLLRRADDGLLAHLPPPGERQAERRSGCPGTMPARNSLVIDTFADDAEDDEADGRRDDRADDAGGGDQPAGARLVVAGLRPSSGRSSADSAAASATAEPDRADRMQAARIAT